LAAALASGADALVVIDLINLEHWHRVCRDTWTAAHGPLIYISGVPRDTMSCNLCYDQNGVGALAAHHLITSGYQRLAYLSMCTDSWSRDRAQGASRHATKRDIPLLRCDDMASAPFNASFEWDADGFARALAPQLTRALVSGDGPLGLICGNDRMALTVADLLNDSGHAAGTVGLIGFDGSETCRHRGISSVALPLDAFGRRACTLLCDASNGTQPPSRELLSGQVLARASTWLQPKL
ncbi:MAG: substrate-binding domain-containing protein, partial [Planctomycetota bacterium]|nr:substrate-binding domain-containing protein [Planctomycetota bacterium]